MISVRFQGKPFNTTVIQAYAPTDNVEEAEVERFYEDLQDLLELNTLVIANTLFQQYKRRLYTRTSPDGQYWNQTNYILCHQREALYSQQKQDWELNCGSDHELVIAKFRLKLKNVGKTTKTIQVWLKSNPLQLYSRSEK